MPKVLVKKSGKKGKVVTPLGKSVLVKRIRATDGRLMTIRTIDAASKTFGSDITYVFGRNVAKARRDNKRVTGVTDVVPAKG